MCFLAAGRNASILWESSSVALEAAVIFAIMSVQLGKKASAATGAAFSQSGARSETMRPCQELGGGNVTRVYLRPPRQLPAFMPLTCLSSIVWPKLLLFHCALKAPCWSFCQASPSRTLTPGAFFLIQTNI